MRDRLRNGVTLTYDTKIGQLDLLLGALPNGKAPQRPFSDGGRWLANERQTVHPSGFQVTGPFEPVSEAAIDVVVEDGSNVSYRAVCAGDAEKALDAALHEQRPMIARGTDATVVPAGQRHSVSFTPPPCSWSIVTSAGASPARAAIRLRSLGTALSAESSGAVWVKLTLLRFKFGPRKIDGKPWDVSGGAPDPEIWVATEQGRFVLVPKMQDTFEAQPMEVAPVVEVSTAAPLRIGATDVDISFDDPMGEATITLEDIRGHGSEFTIDFKDGGTTGTADVRIEFVPKPEQQRASK